MSVIVPGTVTILPLYFIHIFFYGRRRDQRRWARGDKQFAVQSRLRVQTGGSEWYKVVTQPRTMRFGHGAETIQAFGGYGAHRN